MRRLAGALVSLCLLLGGGRAVAAPSAADARDLEPFFAGMLGGLMAERRVPGAVVAVVKDGALVFAHGYGVADLATGRAVDPETTLFRVASVSKLFTATAVMQLVEQGKLDLDADVNTYLGDWKLPATFPQPVTLRHLLTHTGGFDDSFLASTEPLGAAPAMPLGEYLAQHMPPRVMAPGERLSYSNHGIALAGYVVERVSQRPFAEYVRDHVLEPLGMQRSGFSLPDPPPAELAVGYDWKGGAWVPTGVDRIRMAPAGDLYTSASEIARFALAHLDLGRIPGSDARILGAETAAAMHARAFTHHPALSGWCLGFDERRFNDVRAIGHGGSWRGFGTDLVLVPEAGLGLFVSTTREHDARFFDPLWRAFFDRYFPPAAPRAAPEPPPGSRERAAALAGRYVANRHVRGDFLKLGLLLGSLRVSAQPGGSLRIEPRGQSPFDPLRAVEMEPGLWQVDGDERRVAFLRGSDGTEHMAIDSWLSDRVPAWRNPELHGVLLAACAAVFAATLLGWSIAALVRALSGGPPAGSPLSARLLASAVCALSLASLALVGFGLARIAPYVLFAEVPSWLRAARVLPVAAIPLSLGVPWALWRSRASARWTPLARLHFALLALACVVFALLAWSYHLVGM